MFKKLKESLSKTSKNIVSKIETLIKGSEITEEFYEDLEELLIQADLGVNTTVDLVKNIRRRVKEKNINDIVGVKNAMKEEIAVILTGSDGTLITAPQIPTVILMVGVNGVGKTTTIAKLAHRFKADGKKVMLAAGDTFRAAASEQLNVWASRAGVDLIKHGEGADPAAVVYDAVSAAKARKADVLIIDSAGRLHNKINLMDEIAKVRRVIAREIPDAPHEVLLVLDATTGQNAVSQAKTFKEATGVTGIVLTKLDGTAKGGIVISIARELNIPVKLIGIGEGIEDLRDFSAAEFVEALFAEDEEE